MSRRCTVPLLGVYALQSLVVAGAFVAVILLLSLRQQSDFETALHERLSLRQEVTRQEFLAPMLQEEALMNALVDDLANNTERKSILSDGTENLDDLRDFYNGGKNVMQYATRTTFIGQYLRSATARVVYDGVDMPFYNLAVVRFGGEVLLCKNTSWNLLAVPPVGPAVTYPLTNISAQLFSTLVPLDSAASLFPVLDLSDTDRSRREWTAANVIYDLQTMSLLQAYLVTLAGTPRSPITNASDYLGHGMTIVIALDNIVPLVISSSLTPESTTVLFENRRKTILAGQVTFGSLINPTTVAPYVIPNTPDAVLNKAFHELDARCGANLVSECNSTIFTMSVDGERYVVSAVRITTNTRLNMFLMQYNKRSYFFRTFETNLMRGIVIGVIAAAIVVASCITIWISTVRPIARLQSQMALAAVMSNHEAETAAASNGGSVLTELNALHESFVAMNEKLLRARPYLPQALLVSADTEGNDDDEDVELEGIPLDVDHLQRSHISNTDSHDNSSSARSIRYSSNTSIALAELNGSRTKDAHAPKEAHISASGLNFSATHRRIALLVMNAHGFHAATSKLSSQETSRIVTSLVCAVEGVVRNERGIVDSFHGDHFTVSFNTARVVGTALRNAAACALQVESVVRRQTPFKRMSMGLAEGRALVGNMGNANMMKLCAIGPICGQAVMLEMVAQSNLGRIGSSVGEDGGGCLIRESAAADIASNINSNVVGWIRRRKHSHGRTSETAVSVLRSVVHAKNDEWMYVMQQQQNQHHQVGTLRGIAELFSRGLSQCIQSATNHGGGKFHVNNSNNNNNAQHSKGASHKDDEVSSNGSLVSPKSIAALVSFTDNSNQHPTSSFLSFRDRLLSVAEPLVAELRVSAKAGNGSATARSGQIPRLSGDGNVISTVRGGAGASDLGEFSGLGHPMGSSHSENTSSSTNRSPMFLPNTILDVNNSSLSEGAPLVGGGAAPFQVSVSTNNNGSTSVRRHSVSPLIDPLSLMGISNFELPSYPTLAGEQQFVLQVADVLERCGSYSEVSELFKMVILD